MEKEYGLVYYDVPAVNIKTYFRMKKYIDKFCLPVNLSVYIYDWGFKRELEQRLKDVNAKDGNPASINFVKFDKMSNEDLENVATKQLEKTFKSIQEKIHKSLENIIEHNKKEAYLERASNKIKNYERLLTIYEFTRVCEPALNLVKKTLEMEWEALRGNTVTQNA